MNCLSVSTFFRLRSTGAALLLFLGILPGASAASGHWVTTWATGVQSADSNNLPAEPLAENTLRQFVRPSLGGKVVRLRFSNAYGTAPVTIQAAHVALAAGTGSAGTGQVDPATDTALRFRGAPSVVIPPGCVIYSDAVAFDLPNTADVAISLYFGKLSSSTITGHGASRTTSFINAGNAVESADLPNATKTEHWFIISGIDVLADMSSQSVIAFGDSITDGRGSITNGNTRWPDYLAKRLVANPSTVNRAVANTSIGATTIGGFGVNRFFRDVLSQNGARYLVLFIGINDILYGGASAQSVINNYTTVANQAHAMNIKVYGATITPFNATSSQSSIESTRQTINTWIRTNTVYDGYFDFDAVVRNPSDATKIQAAYDSDGLHLTSAGYQALADSINLSVFTQ